MDLAFSSDGQVLAAVSASGSVRLFSVPSLSLLAEVDVETVDAPGSFVAVCSKRDDDGHVDLLVGWDMNRVIANCSIANGRLVGDVRVIRFYDSEHLEGSDTFLNTAAYDSRSGTLFVGNSLRSSILTFKVSDSGKFEFLTEYCLDHPTVSLALVPKTEEDDASTLLAAQTR